MLKRLFQRRNRRADIPVLIAGILALALSFYRANYEYTLRYRMESALPSHTVVVETFDAPFANQMVAGGLSWRGTHDYQARLDPGILGIRLTPSTQPQLTRILWITLSRGSTSHRWDPGNSFVGWEGSFEQRPDGLQLESEKKRDTLTLTAIPGLERSWAVFGPLGWWV